MRDDWTITTAERRRRRRTVGTRRRHRRRCSRRALDETAAAGGQRAWCWCAVGLRGLSASAGQGCVWPLVVPNAAALSPVLRRAASTRPAAACRRPTSDGRGILGGGPRGGRIAPHRASRISRCIPHGRGRRARGLPARAVREGVGASCGAGQPTKRRASQLAPSKSMHAAIDNGQYLSMAQPQGAHVVSAAVFSVAHKGRAARQCLHSLPSLRVSLAGDVCTP